MILYTRHLRTQKCSKYQSSIGLHIEKKKKKDGFCQFTDILYLTKKFGQGHTQCNKTQIKLYIIQCQPHHVL